MPDNQEVYLHRTGLSSIVFDILERIQRPDHAVDTDEQALLYHFKDITEEGHVREGTEATEESQIWESGRVIVPNLGQWAPAYHLFATQRALDQTPVDVRSGKPPVMFTGISMTLIRLVEQKTDLVISVNVPHSQGGFEERDLDFAKGKMGPLMVAAKEYQEKLLASLKIEDWSLFVQD